MFALFFVAPSNVAQTLGGPPGHAGDDRADQAPARARPADLAAVPALPRATRVHGDLGYDYYHQVPVTTIIAAGAADHGVAGARGRRHSGSSLGIFNGVISAIHPRSFADRVSTVFALFFYSMPTFLLGLLLLYFLYFRLTLAGSRWFPAGGYVAAHQQSPVRWFQHLILPWITLALLLAATYTRLTRGSMLDVLGEDYIRTARSKGIRETPGDRTGTACAAR